MNLIFILEYNFPKSIRHLEMIGENVRWAIQKDKEWIELKDKKPLG